MKAIIFFVALIFSGVRCDVLSEAYVAWPRFMNFTTVENNGYIDSKCEERPGGYCFLQSIEILQDITEENQITLDYVIKEYNGYQYIGSKVSWDTHENIPFCKPFEDRNEESSILKLLRLAMKLPEDGCPVTAQNNNVGTTKFRTRRVYLKLSIYKCQHYIILFTIKNPNSEEIASGGLMLFSQNYYCENGNVPSY